MSQLFDFISMENDTTEELYWYIDRTPDYNILNTINNSNIDCSNIERHDIIILCKNIEIFEYLEKNCYICMEDREKEDFCSLNCNHVICGICTKQMLKSFKTICCPLCRTSTTDITTQIKSIQQELSDYCL